MNLQPSELMKIGLILFLAKYYHRISIEGVNSFRYLILPITVLVAPIILVATQPDLGTSILIAGTGIIIIWLAGLNIKYFVYSGLLLIVSLPFAVSLLKPYQKSRILTFFNPDRDPSWRGLSDYSIKNSNWFWRFFRQRFFKGYAKLFRIFA